MDGLHSETTFQLLTGSLSSVNSFSINFDLGFSVSLWLLNKRISYLENGTFNFNFTRVQCRSCGTCFCLLSSADSVNEMSWSSPTEKRIFNS